MFSKRWVKSDFRESLSPTPIIENMEKLKRDQGALQMTFPLACSNMGRVEHFDSMTLTSDIFGVGVNQA